MTQKYEADYDMRYKIWDSQTVLTKNKIFFWYDIVSTGEEWPTFRRSMLPSSSGSSGPVLLGAGRFEFQSHGYWNTCPGNSVSYTDVQMKSCVISAFRHSPFCSGTECYVNVRVLASDIMYLVHFVNSLHVRLINTVFD